MRHRTGVVQLQGHCPEAFWGPDHGPREVVLLITGPVHIIRTEQRSFHSKAIRSEGSGARDHHNRMRPEQ